MDTPETQTSVNKTELPDWVDKAGQENLEIANTLSERPYNAYTGALTAGATPLQNAADANAAANMNAYKPQMAQASELAGISPEFTAGMDKAAGLANVDPRYYSQMDAAGNAVTGATSAANAGFDEAAGVARSGTNYNPRSFLQGNVSEYMNPYIDTVEKRAIDNANIAYKNNLNTIGDSAIAAQAFGGSRHGIAEGVAAAENARNVGDISAQLRAQGFDTASGLLENDLTRDMQGEQMRQQAGAQLGSLANSRGSLGQQEGVALGDFANSQQTARANSASQLAQIATTGQQARSTAAGQLADFAESSNTMSNQNTTMAATLGEQARQIDQAFLQEDYAKWKEAEDYPLEQLNLRLAALGATPYGGTQTQTSTAQGGGNTGMQIAGGLLGMLPFMFSSDRDDKEDIEELGVDPDTGLKMYAYRYKGDPKNTPKVVGPMAQDIEKKHPGMVKEIGGHKVVKNLGFGGGI